MSLDYKYAMLLEALCDANHNRIRPGALISQIYIFNCVPCRALRGKMGDEKMASIPAKRTSMEPQFTFCGINMFGHFYTKEGRTEHKRYAALFTFSALEQCILK